MRRFLTFLLFLTSIICLISGIKWLFDGDLFYGIWNTVLSIFNTYYLGKYALKKYIKK